MKKILPIGVITTLAIFSGVGVALWASNYAISGQAVYQTGTQPIQQSCVLPELNETTVSHLCNYDNPDGDVSIEYSCSTANLTSTDSKCKVVIL